MNEQTIQSNDASCCSTLRAILTAMRPAHWVKNVFVAAPILTSGRFSDPAAWLRCLPAVGAFCLLSSSVYLINDVCDRDEDRAHPVKCNRPVASGRLSVGAAVAAAILLMAIAATLTLIVVELPNDGRQPLGGWGMGFWAFCYLVLNLVYCFWLRTHAVVDVLAIAMGFVLRAMAGAAAIAVPISPWLVLCTLTLCLFIALAKRRSEIAEMPAAPATARKANLGYTKDFLEHMLTVSTALAILTYCIYCLAPQTISRIGSAHMVWTIPLVIYGMFRYYRAVHGAGCGDAVAVLVKDKIMWLVVAAFVVLTGLVIKFGSHAAIRSILDLRVR